MLPAWSATTLLGGAANYYDSDTSQLWETAGYYLGPEGMVHLRGLLYNIAASNGSTTTDIFTLPLGYRPERVVLTSVFSSNGTVRVDVKPDGSVRYLNGTAIVNSGSGFLTLAGISFRQFG